MPRAQALTIQTHLGAVSQTSVTDHAAHRANTTRVASSIRARYKVYSTCPSPLGKYGNSCRMYEMTDSLPSMPDDYVRIALTEDEFARLLEIVKGVDEPVVLKLRAKALSHRAKQMKREGAARPPAKRFAR